MSLRPAQIIAATVEICCPHCGEPLPSPDSGSDAWLPEQIPKDSPKYTCNSCDEEFRVMFQNTAQVVTR
jgi:transposase-like protein